MTASKSTAQRDYDALLIVSFGGPEGPADVSPFLDNVFKGLRVSPETKARVAKRYEQFGGVSPINAQTRAFIKALQHELDAHGPALPIYWGNRNWHPLLKRHVAQMAHAGMQPRARVRHEHVQLVQRLPQVPRGSLRSRERAAERAANRQASRRLQPSGLHRGDGGSRQGRARNPARGRARSARRSCSRRTACRNRWRAPRATKRSCARAASSSATRSSTSAGGSSTRATTRRTAASRGSARTS